jgi:hypothetical protein
MRDEQHAARVRARVLPVPRCDSAIAPSGDGGRCSDSSNPAVADSERTAPDLRAVAVRG